MRARVLLLLPLVLVLANPAVAPAEAATSYCSPSGDVCYGTWPNPIRLRLSLAARYFSHFQICVRPPGGGRECHRFRVRKRKNGTYGRTVRWAHNFDDDGDGVYRVRFRQGGHALGPAVEFQHGFNDVVLPVPDR